MSKPVTPIRRSRPSTGGANELPVNASMQLLQPESSPGMHASIPAEAETWGSVSSRPGSSSSRSSRRPSASHHHHHRQPHQVIHLASTAPAPRPSSASSPPLLYSLSSSRPSSAATPLLAGTMSTALPTSQGPPLHSLPVARPPSAGPQGAALQATLTTSRPGSAAGAGGGAGEGGGGAGARAAAAAAVAAAAAAAAAARAAAESAPPATRTAASAVAGGSTGSGEGHGSGDVAEVPEEEMPAAAAAAAGNGSKREGTPHAAEPHSEELRPLPATTPLCLSGHCSPLPEGEGALLDMPGTAGTHKSFRSEDRSFVAYLESPRWSEQGTNDADPSHNDGPFLVPDYNDVLGGPHSRHHCHGHSQGQGQGEGEHGQGQSKEEADPNKQQDPHTQNMQAPQQQLREGGDARGGEDFSDTSLPQLHQSEDPTFMQNPGAESHFQQQQQQVQQQELQQVQQQEGDDEARPLTAASSCVGGPGVFFTELSRSYVGAQEEDAMSTRSNAATEACLSMTSANPMQEPSGLSALGHAHSSGDGAEGRSPEDMELDAYTSGYDALEDGSHSEWDNPMLTPPETAPPTAEVSRASLLSLVQDLHESTHVRESTPDSSGPARTASQPTPSIAGEEGGNEAEEEDAVGDLALEQEASRARLQEVEDQQQQRRNDLGGYILSLKEKIGDDGKPLVELPGNYLAMVESLLVARRHEYAALDGWLGPTRFQNLPINQLPDRHEDPRVDAGLACIKALDAKLADKETEAMILIREADPERWAAQERARLEKRARAMEEMLKRERMKRMRAAKLARALDQDRELSSRASEAGSLRSSIASSALGREAAARGRYHPMLMLRPEEEALVEAVLQRPPTDLAESGNPFQLSGQEADPEAAAALTPAGVQGPPSPFHPPLSPNGSPLGALDSRAVAQQHGASPLSSPQGSASVCHSAASFGWEGGGGGGKGAMLVLPGGESAADIAAAITGHSASRSYFGGGESATHAEEIEETEGPGRRESAQGDRPGSQGQGPGVDLAMGLAVHTQALLAARQAAVKGLPLSEIDARLSLYAMEHCWGAGGTLADFASLNGKGGGPLGQAGTHSSPHHDDPLGAPQSGLQPSPDGDAGEGEIEGSSSHGATQHAQPPSQQQQQQIAPASSAKHQHGAPSKGGGGSSDKGAKKGGPAQPQAQQQQQHGGSGNRGAVPNGSPLLQPPAPFVRKPPVASEHASHEEAQQKRDYNREEREAKEAIKREADLDARIRAFKTSDPAGMGRLSMDQLAAVLEECRHLAALAEQRQRSAAAAAAASAAANLAPATPLAQGRSSSIHRESGGVATPRTTAPAKTPTPQQQQQTHTPHHQKTPTPHHQQAKGPAQASASSRSHSTRGASSTPTSQTHRTGAPPSLRGPSAGSSNQGPSKLAAANGLQQRPSQQQQQQQQQTTSGQQHQQQQQQQQQRPISGQQQQQQRPSSGRRTLTSSDSKQSSDSKRSSGQGGGAPDRGHTATATKEDGGNKGSSSSGGGRGGGGGGQACVPTVLTPILFKC